MRSRRVIVDWKKRTWCFSLSLSLFIWNRVKNWSQLMPSLEFTGEILQVLKMKNQARDDVVNRARRNEIHFPTWINHQIINANPVVSYCDALGRAKKRGKGRKRKVKRLFRLKGNEDARFPTRKRFLSIALRTKGENTENRNGIYSPVFLRCKRVFPDTPRSRMT